MLGQAYGRRTDAVCSLEKQMRCAHQTLGTQVAAAGARMEQVAAEEQRQDELRRLARSTMVHHGPPWSTMVHHSPPQ